MEESRVEWRNYLVFLSLSLSLGLDSPAGEERFCVGRRLGEGVGGSKINLFVSSCFLLVKFSSSSSSSEREKRETLGSDNGATAVYAVCRPSVEPAVGLFPLSLSEARRRRRNGPTI